jgi:hypothetical protein
VSALRQPARAAAHALQAGRKRTAAGWPPWAARAHAAPRSG